MTIQEFKDQFLNLLNKAFSDKEKVYLDNAIGLTLKIPADTKRLGITKGKYESLVYIVARTTPVELDLSLNNVVPVEISLKFFFATEDEQFRYTKNYEHIKHRRKIPLDIISKDEYFFDYSNQKFFDVTGKVLTIQEIFSTLYKLHTKPNIVVKAKLWVIRVLLPNILQFIYRIISVALYLLYGVRSPSLIKRYFANQDPRNTEEIVTKTESPTHGGEANFFGIKLKKRTLVTYSILVLVSYTLLFYLNYFPRFLILIFNNNFLVTVFAIVTLAIFETISKLLDNLLNNISKSYYHLQFQEVRVS